MSQNENQDPSTRTQEEIKQIVTPGQLVRKRFMRNKLAIVGIGIIAFMLLFSIIGPFLSPYGEYSIFYTKDGVEMEKEGNDLTQSGILLLIKSPPSATHWLGTDRDGRDVLTRLMYGGRVSLIISAGVMALELLIGVTLGGIAGYYGKWIDMIIMRVVDIFYCLPSLPMMMIIASIMMSLKLPQRSQIVMLMLVMAVLGWVGVARIVRAQILSLREQEYMVAAESIGLSSYRRIFKHLIPNVMPQLIVITTLGLGSVILSESALSFLGMGVKFPFASWGNMVNAINDPIILRECLWIWVPPGLSILLTVLGYNFIGDGLRDAFDPKMKR